MNLSATLLKCPSYKFSAELVFPVMREHIIAKDN